MIMMIKYCCDKWKEWKEIVEDNYIIRIYKDGSIAKVYFGDTDSQDEQDKRLKFIYCPYCRRRL